MFVFSAMNAYCFRIVLILHLSVHDPSKRKKVIRYRKDEKRQEKLMHGQSYIRLTEKVKQLGREEVHLCNKQAIYFAFPPLIVLLIRKNV